MKRLQACVAIVFVMNCVMCIWLLMLPRGTDIQREILSSEADELGAMELKVKTAQLFSEILDEHLSANRLVLFVLAMNICLLLFIAFLCGQFAQSDINGIVEADTSECR